MDDGSETSNQCLLAGIMLPPSFALSFTTLSSLRWLLRLRIKNNTSSASSSKLLEKLNETTIADCHCSRASGQDFTRILEPYKTQTHHHHHHHHNLCANILLLLILLVGEIQQWARSRYTDWWGLWGCCVFFFFFFFLAMEINYDCIEL